MGDIAVMRIGTVRGIKDNEFRVGLTSDHVKAYHSARHSVYVEKDAEIGSGFPNEEYRSARTIVFDTAKEIWDTIDTMVKVKKLLKTEYQCFHKDLVLYTYLRLAMDRPLMDALLSAGAEGVTYETLTERDGSIPLLAPMSQIAGRLSVQEGAKYLEKPVGGSGMLLSSVPGTSKARVVILGASTVGVNTCEVAMGMGAGVTITDISLPRLAHLDDTFGVHIQTIYSTDPVVGKEPTQADLVTGSVLVLGEKAPKIVKCSYLRDMRPSSVVADVAMDQGGCCETAHVTYHDGPVCTVGDVVHYCVGNMPGVVPRTFTIALTNATLRCGLQIAENRLEGACRINPVLYSAVNTYSRKCTCFDVADGSGIESCSTDQLF